VFRLSDLTRCPQRAIALDPMDASSRINLCVLYKRMQLLEKYEQLCQQTEAMYCTDKFVLEKLADMKCVSSGWHVSVGSNADRRVAGQGARRQRF
jgi:hypothetical protein